MLHRHDHIAIGVECDKCRAVVGYLREFRLLKGGGVELVYHLAVTAGDINESVGANGHIHGIVQPGSHHGICLCRRREAVKLAFSLVVVPVIARSVERSLPHSSTRFGYLGLCRDRHVCRYVAN